MKAKTELLLYRMGWVLDHMMHPTFRNMNDSFESWAYGSGFLRQIQSLESKRLVESKPDDSRSGKRLYRLTEHGRLAAFGGRDPELEWSRPWDGMWRMVLFDVPEAERRVRGQIRQVLNSLRFGGLQKSVWISPHPLMEVADVLRKLEVASSSLILIEGSCCAGETPQDVTKTAWNFAAIKRAWQSLAVHLDSAPATGYSLSPSELKVWSNKEMSCWKACAAIDPFLPKQLLPDDYIGRTVWKKRCETLTSLGTNPTLFPGLFERSSQ
jgi:phenylacetic acid degradation operon negative regulatory protein